MLLTEKLILNITKDHRLNFFLKNEDWNFSKLLYWVYYNHFRGCVFGSCYLTDYPRNAYALTRKEYFIIKSRFEGGKWKNYLLRKN